VGIGVEGPLYKGIVIGGELGYVAPHRYFSSGIGVASVNGAYHFLNWSSPSERKAVPFVSAGYSLLFRDGTAKAINFGEGLNYWMLPVWDANGSSGLQIRLPQVRQHMGIPAGAHVPVICWKLATPARLL
jgi:hypothetical protein